VLNNPQREAVIKKLIGFLQEKRLQKKLSVNEVATRSGLSRAMVSRVEKGERLPTIDTLLRISEALEIDLARLIRKAVNTVKGGKSKAG
jgi:transcriptional regulator with XRE-family HTH domain